MKPVEALTKKAFENDKKNDLGPDDNKMWDDVAIAEEKAKKEAADYATKTFVDKYGQETLDKLNKRESMIRNGKEAAEAAVLIIGVKAIHDLVKKGKRT